ncbi:hypothetical protein ACP70R_043924 [Stipagrostis hirtigluma subsp. patula]
MRRRRWARAATALCLAVVVLQLARGDVVVAVEGRRQLSAKRAHGHGRHAGTVLPSSAAPPVHVAVARAQPDPRAAAAVGLDAAAAAAAVDGRCKSVEHKTVAAGGHATACAGAGADDNKRRIPTGPNPLHNR